MGRLILSFAAGATLVTGGFALALSEKNQSGEPNVSVVSGEPNVSVVSAVDIKEDVNDEKSEVTTLEVTFGPGVASRPHRHPGPIFGYVLEGEFEFAVGGQKTRTLKAGDTFYEPAMVLHRVSKNPSMNSQTRVLAVLIHPRDAEQLVIPQSSDGDE